MDYKERKQERKKGKKNCSYEFLNPGKSPFAAQNKQVLMPFGKY